MKYFFYSLIALLHIVFLCNAAQVGFNTVGYLINVPDDSSIYSSVAINDDKIIAVGTTNGGNSFIARFNQDGSLDQILNQTNTRSYYSVAIDDEGRIIAVGSNNAGGNVSPLLIARFDDEGTLDGAFGTNGLVTDTITNAFFGNAVAIQADGKIVVVGSTLNNTGFVARFNDDGTLDTDFNVTGFINTSTGTNSEIYNSVAIDNQNRILAVGRSRTPPNNPRDGLIARFNNDGTLDKTFDQDGGNSLVYNSVAIHNGKIIVVGQTDATVNNNFNQDGFVARFNDDGTLDTDFNVTGFINTENGTNSLVYNSVAIQADGKIVAVGQTDDDNNGLIARFNADGTLDTDFNRTGFIKAENGTNSNAYFSVVIDDDGRIVVAGQTDAVIDNDRNGLIARFNQNGTLDTSFNRINGRYTSVALQPDGKIVAVGTTDEDGNGNTNGLITRFNADGTLDTDFNENGINGAPGYINQAGNTNASAYFSVVIDDNGKIVAVGTTDEDGNGNTNGLIARFNADGILDTDFNENEINGAPGYINQAGNTNASAYFSVVIDDNGKILVVGQTNVVNNNRNGLIARFNADGTLDTDFNENGINGAPGYINQAGNINASGYFSVVIDDNGKILAVGQTNAVNNNRNGLIARFNADGTLDMILDAENKSNLKSFREYAKNNNISIVLLG